MRRAACLVLCLVAAPLAPAPAAAAPANAEEAARLLAMFETYLGRPAAGQAPSIAVTPAGEDYKAAFDLTRLAAPMHDFGVDVVAAGPYDLVLTPLPDGTWRVKREPLPEIGIKTKEGITYSLALTGSGGEGIFDPALKAFRHAESDLGGSRTSTSSTKGSTSTTITASGHQVTGASGPNADDVSTSLTRDARDVTYRSQSTGVASAIRASVPVEAKAATSRAAVTIAHERRAKLLDLWAFLAAHPSREALVAAQEDVRSRALAVVPAAGAVSIRSENTGVAISANGMRAAISKFTENLSYDPASTTEGLALSLGLHGVAIDVPPALPAWIAASLPHDLDLALATSPLDIGAAVRTIVQGADLGKDEVVPRDVLDKAVDALTPGGEPTLAVKPSAVSNALMSLAFYGAVTASGGKFVVEAVGLDKEIAAIAESAADDPLAAQAGQILNLARLLAETKEGGKAVWEIESRNSALTVNGKALR